MTSILGLIQIIKEENYQYDQEMVNMLDTAVQLLDKNIRSIVNKTTNL